MVHVIVSDQHRTEVVETHPVGLKLLFQASRADSGINDDTSLATPALVAE